MAKKQQAVPAAPAPQVINAAPGYDPYAGATAPSSVMAQGGPYGGAAPSSANGTAVITPPPSREDQSEFINATFLWRFGRPIRATIINVRDATGTGRDFGGQKRVKRAWFLDFKLETAHPVSGDDEATGRINEGDSRHSKLWAAFQGQWINRTVTLRLTNPGDIDPLSNKPSKAAWMLDCN